MFLLFKVLSRAISLDIFDLNYLAGNESSKLLENNATILPRKGLVIRFFAFAVHLLQEIKRTFLTKPIPKNSILFFVSTRNQRDSVIDLAKSVSNSALIGEKCELQSYFPLFWAYLVSLFFLPILFWRYLESGKYHKKSFLYFSDIYLLTYGYYVVGSFWLRKIRPSCLVTPNDHNMQNRVVTAIVSEIKVPSIYIQHASVTDKFPPLNFDFALLEGEDALQKYGKRGAGKTRVFLIGMPKADAYEKFVNASSSLTHLGICTNMLDDEDSVFTLCKKIRYCLKDLDIILRPHPSDKRRFGAWKRIAKDCGLRYSDPVTESAFSFLVKIDAVIAGESNIHLEAALLNVYPLYFDFNGESRDWYGFLDSGVIEYCSEAEDLFHKISHLMLNKPSVRGRCRPYCETVGTAYDWHSGLLAKTLIEAIAAGLNIQNSTWKSRAGCELHAYGLN